MITEILDSTFDYCKRLESIVIPNTVTLIGNHAFSSCGINSIVIPNSVTTIGEGAFSHCGGLEGIVIPNSVKSIGKGAFGFCEKLKKITLSNNITKILDRTFEYCESLRNITIPNSVTYIGYGAFSDCRNLRNVIVPNKTQTEFSSFGDLSIYKNIIRVPFTLNYNYSKQEPKKALEQKQPIVPMDKVNAILNEIQKYINNLQNLEIKPLDSYDATTIAPFASELKDYPMIISSAYYSSQSLDKNLKSRKKKINKLLDAISENDRQSIFDKIENIFLDVNDGEIVLNKDAMKQLKDFSDSEIEMLKRQNQILSKLKEMSKLYNTKLKGCQSELNTTFVSDTNDKIEQSDIKSLNNAVQVKRASLDGQLLESLIAHEQINNAINFNILYMTSLNEVTTRLLPSIITKVARNKLVIKQESVKAIKEVADILKQALNKPMEINTTLEEPKTSMR